MGGNENDADITMLCTEYVDLLQYLQRDSNALQRWSKSYFIVLRRKIKKINILEGLLLENIKGELWKIKSGTF